MTVEQRNDLMLAVADRRDWFIKLRERMAAQQWSQDDELLAKVGRACEAADGVIETIYLACRTSGPSAPVSP